MRHSTLGIIAGLLAMAAPATAFELDSVIPSDIPGYGTPFGVTYFNRLRRVDDSAGVQIGGLTISPALALGAGFDSAPNGAAPASISLTQTPSLEIADPQIGLGAFAGGDFQQYPGNNAQNITGSALAAGEKMLLPRETITIAASYLATQQTGFALTTIAIRHPQAFTVFDVRARDEIALGPFTLTPGFAISRLRFKNAGSENRTDISENLLLDYSPDGPGRLVIKLAGTQARYQAAAFNATTTEALAGIEDSATAIWTLRLLGGLAHRAAQTGGALTAPVAEASLDWVPDGLDRLRLDLTREIDDPTNISAAPDTLSQIKLTLAHEYLRNLIMNLSLQAAHAVFLKTPDKETLIAAQAGLDWHLNTALAVDLAYAFNDRQANFLPAANEHLVTASLTWTP